jgi:hypothetical protein
MTMSWVVEHLDVIKYIPPGFFAVDVILPLDESGQVVEN